MLWRRTIDAWLRSFRSQRPRWRSMVTRCVWTRGSGRLWRASSGRRLRLGVLQLSGSSSCVMATCVLLIPRCSVLPAPTRSIVTHGWDVHLEAASVAGAALGVGAGGGRFLSAARLPRHRSPGTAAAWRLTGAAWRHPQLGVAPRTRVALTVKGRAENKKKSTVSVLVVQQPRARGVCLGEVRPYNHIPFSSPRKSRAQPRRTSTAFCRKGGIHQGGPQRCSPLCSAPSTCPSTSPSLASKTKLFGFQATPQQM